MRKTLITAGLLGSALLTSAAMAQTSPAPVPQSSAPASGTFMTRLEPGQMLASKIMDGDVAGADNKDIGDVEDLVLDRNGRVVAVVIEVDEGLGDRTVALPLGAVQMNAADATTTGSVQGSGQTGGSSAARDDDMRIVVTTPVDQLKSAPEFDDDND
ncbi:PRC-barrel domain-containing protein [Microvirga sp. 3-52]|uniref:PRC-barrel domain-containing protein n=1 Tax=Microvirga sp. 3-52 TaxID=2792425 RepID=UPI001AC543CA|nr:PRC-barrel domain-containing protein [Microvirga sp. 3-52]MBO1904783.1 PRC-barrel domain-containing protein [Microvirga sp. 3-52]MBS7454696.1 PRC-barrel domain-containing protein [Microvirga sp. 3-52]